MYPIARFVAAVALLAGIAGCGLDPQQRFSPQFRPVAVGDPKGVVQRALSFCGEKTEAAETRCVTAALAEAHLTRAALAATIPGCRLGRECTLNYKTRDRSALLSVDATDYVFEWNVTFDFKAAGSDAATIPFKVLRV